MLVNLHLSIVAVAILTVNFILPGCLARPVVLQRRGDSNESPPYGPGIPKPDMKRVAAYAGPHLVASAVAGGRGARTAVAWTGAASHGVRSVEAFKNGSQQDAADHAAAAQACVVGGVLHLTCPEPLDTINRSARQFGTGVVQRVRGQHPPQAEERHHD